MVLGEDGRKMSKSLGNFIVPEQVFETNGADALRQWAALGGAPGNDVLFQWKEIVAASRFQQKLWSIFRFSTPLMASTGEAPGQVDRWFLVELDALIKKATKAMDGYQFDEAFRAIRVFTWEVLADNYIELIKARLYGQDGPEKRAAQNALYTAIDVIVRLMAPFIPFITEEIYHTMTEKSVHTQPWPEPLGIEANTSGATIKDVAAAIRRYKAEKGLALNAPLPGITVYSGEKLETTDLQGVANSPVQSMTGSPEIETRPAGVKPSMKILGPKFKGEAGNIIKALNSMNPADVASQKASKTTIKVNIEGTSVEVPSEAVEVLSQTISSGSAVDLLKVGEATVLVKR
jgi:valyl-tRNA synthetase